MVCYECNLMLCLKTHRCLEPGLTCFCIGFHESGRFVAIASSSVLSTRMPPGYLFNISASRIGNQREISTPRTFRPGQVPTQGLATKCALPTSLRGNHSKDLLLILFEKRSEL